MKLSDFMPSVCDEANRQIGRPHLSLHNIYKVMDVDISSHKELDNPLNRDPNVYYFRPRQTPLLGNEEIEGDYFLFEFVFHFEEMWLREMRSLKAIEERIVGPNGVSDGYTACMVAIVRGKVKPYKVTHVGEVIKPHEVTAFKVVNGVKDKNGRKVIMYQKDRQVKIRWLDEGQ